MAGEKLEVVQRDEAWITVLTPLDPAHANSAAAFEAQQGEVFADSPPGKSQANQSQANQRAKKKKKSSLVSIWSVLSALVLLGGLAATAYGLFRTLDRYFPEIAELRGVDGEPPAILSQPDSPEGLAEEYAARVLEWATSWPLVLVAPLMLASLVGLFAGWIRWRLGRSRAAELRARRAELETARLAANNAEQSERIGSMDREIVLTRQEVAELTGQLDSAERHTLTGDQLTAAVEAKTREAARLTVDLEDALTERDALEAKIIELETTIASGSELTGKAGETADKLEAAKDLIRQQAKKIASLQNHLDQVRRRTSEMAQEARNAQQLRNAWAQAEEVIADLSRQLGEESLDRDAYKPQTAESIVANNSRVTELEALLNEAAGVIDGLEDQLRSTRFQVSERDTALARADVRFEAAQTEVSLLTKEIEQAAFVIASLKELPRQLREDDSLLVDLRDALASERARNHDLERQLRGVSSRALRLEQRLIGDRSKLDGVLDLTSDLSEAVDRSETNDTETSAA